MKNIILLFTVSLLINISLFADSSIGKVIAVRGDAVIKDQYGDMSELKRGRDVYVGEEIYTKSSSYVKIFLKDDSVLTIGEDSRFKAKKFIYNDSERTSVFQLFKGKLKAVINKFVNKAMKNHVSVETPTAVAGVRGTEFIVGVGDNGNAKETSVDVLDGAVEVSDSSGNGSVLVTKGFFTKVLMGRSPLQPQQLTPKALKMIRRQFYIIKRNKKEEKKNSDKIFKASASGFVLAGAKRKNNFVKIRRKTVVKKPVVKAPVDLGNNALVIIKFKYPGSK